MIWLNVLLARRCFITIQRLFIKLQVVVRQRDTVVIHVGERLVEIVANLVEDEIVICKYCGHPEYYGKMRWLNGKCECRQCYRHHYEEVHGEIYRWDDLSGKVPSMMEYDTQEEMKKRGN